MSFDRAAMIAAALAFTVGCVVLALAKCAEAA